MKRPIRFGKYWLLERINVGGMAEVFRAKVFGVEGFERLVAVKKILPNIAEDEEFIKMFVDEAKIAVQLNHANIAQVFDLGKEGDAYYIAMEYVHGKDLRAIFDRCREMGQPMPIAQACFIVMKVCEGLDYAHNKRDPSGRELGLVHRDISPQNILISYEGEVKIIDFGIAKAVGRVSKTQAGILKGKFGYMSPEQVRGLPLDRRSDVFSVGIVLYELLTGERLFVGESDFSTLEKVRNVEILPPSTYNRRIPEELERIVLKALAKDVEDRYQTAIDLHDELQAFMYSAGEFYSSKDLANWMKRVFAREIEEESRKLKEELAFRPPESAAGGGPPPLPVEQASFAAAPAAAALEPDPFRASAGLEDLDWDDEEAETQLYDKPPMGLDQELDFQPTPAEPAGPPVEFERPAKAPPRRTLLGLGAMGQEPGPELEPLAAEPQPVEQVDPDALLAESAAAGSDLGLGAVGMEPSPAVQDFGYAAEPVPATEVAPQEVPAAKPRRIGLWIGWSLGGLAAVALLAGVVWYLFFRAKKGTVKIRVRPVPGLRLYVDSEPVELEPGEPAVLSLEPGEHILQAEAPGHKPLEQKFEVAAGGQTLVEVALVPSGAVVAQGKGALKVVTTPPGALVYLDGKPLTQSRTPLRISDLPAGPHRLKIELPNYLPWPPQGEETVLVEANKEKEVQVALRPKEVRVFVESPVPSARVTLYRDGEPLVEDRSVPFNYKFQPDEKASYEVVVRADGYRPFRQKLDVAGKPEVVVEARLERRGGPSVALRPRRVRRYRPRPRPPEVDEPRLPPVEEPPPRPRPRPRPRPPRPRVASGPAGKIRIGSKPWATVFVDGRKRGTTPLILKVPPGRHTVRLVNPQFGIKKTFVVNVPAGGSKTIIYRHK